MNYYEARQRKTDGRWDWTRMNDGAIFPSGPCRSHQDGHATKEEAELHAYEHNLSTARVFTMADQQLRCEDCKQWASGGLETRHGAAVVLCELHRTTTVLRRLRTFAPGLTIVSSW